MASVAGSTAIFVVASTFAFAVAQRRRDLGVLRLGGATRRQVLTVFAAEALLVVGIGLVLAVAASALNLGGLWIALIRLFGATRSWCRT